MRNLVLYRKYRPKTFSEIVGQEHIVKTLTNAISQDMVSHAYLFYGPRGTGKTTIARLLAKAVNCENREKGEYEPCNKCDSCREINEGKSLDLIEIDAASNRGIDEIRELKSGIKFAPAKARYKIFIIDESHQLTKEAANALLKILEEPPSHVIFILATTEIQKMIPTIVSRCQKFNFRRLRIEEIIRRMESIARKEKMKISKEALRLIAFNSEGSIRDAESILDKVFTFHSFKEKEREITEKDIKEILGLVENSLVSEFLDFLLERNAKDAINYLHSVLDKGYDVKTFLDGVIEYVREAMLFKINPDIDYFSSLVSTDEEKRKVLGQVKDVDEQRLKQILKILLDVEPQLRYSPIPQLPLELAIVEICGIV